MGKPGKEQIRPYETNTDFIVTGKEEIFPITSQQIIAEQAGFKRIVYPDGTEVAVPVRVIHFTKQPPKSRGIL